MIGSGIDYRYYRISNMKRVDLYLKVTVEVEEDETPERIAGELCRRLEKTYPVRTAELSSVATRE